MAGAIIYENLPMQAGIRSRDYPASRAPRPARETAVERLVGSMRLVLASSALLITYVDPTNPERFVGFTYVTLGLYLAYSFALWAAMRRNTCLVPPAVAPWIDMAWSAVLIGLSGGTNSVFFSFFFFAIMVASFTRGFVSGLWVTLISSVSFSAISWAFAPAHIPSDLNQFLLRPVYLLILGYLMAYWGESEIQRKRRLTLLKDVSTLSNPRFGVDRTLGALLERLRDFFDATMCVLVTTDQLPGEFRLRRADLHNPEGAMRAESISAEVAGPLLALPTDRGLIYRGEPRWWERWQATEAPPSAGAGHGASTLDVSRITVVLSAASFLTAPIHLRGSRSGRLYLTSQRRNHFHPSDCRFIAQVLDHTVPILENIELVDRLAKEAAETERRRIVLDLHDGVMQPYIALKMGLAAVRDKLAIGNANVADDVERLIELADIGFGAACSNRQKLEHGKSGEFSLGVALRRFSAKFAKASGIAVDVDTRGDFELNDRLAAEVFQIVVEGLSNVRRHTRSARARVSLARRSDRLDVRIANEPWADSKSVPFSPRSIVERTEALGGSVRIVEVDDLGTVVEAEIPL